MIELITHFISENFIRPILDPSVPGYNMVNTLTYGIILLAVTFYLIYPALKKRGFIFDWPFLKMLLPYILFGTSLRVLEDQKILLRSANPLEAGFYILTPGIWILTFALVMIGIFLGKKWGKQKHEREQKITLVFGLVLALPIFAFNVLHAEELGGAISIAALTAIVCGIIFTLGKKFRWNFLENPLARTAFFGQVLDTSATFIALQFFGCGEQHVLPRLLFGAFGNISFFFVKIPLVLLVLYWLNKEYTHGKDADTHLLGFILLFVTILGLATGTRDLITVMVGTCSP